MASRSAKRSRFKRKLARADRMRENARWDYSPPARSLSPDELAAYQQELLARPNTTPPRIRLNGFGDALPP